jgi:hypothetical protein
MMVLLSSGLPDLEYIGSPPLLAALFSSLAVKF